MEFDFGELDNIEKGFVGSTLLLALSLLFPWFSLPIGISVNAIQTWYGGTLFVLYALLTVFFFKSKFYSTYTSLAVNLGILVKLGYFLYSLESLGGLGDSFAFVPQISGWNMLSFGIYFFTLALLLNIATTIMHFRTSTTSKDSSSQRNIFALIVIGAAGLAIPLYHSLTQAGIYLVLSLFALICIRI
jgi:hypothetical protein